MMVAKRQATWAGVCCGASKAAVNGAEAFFGRVGAVEAKLERER
jgi:hypothetical protein